MTEKQRISVFIDDVKWLKSMMPQAQKEYKDEIGDGVENRGLLHLGDTEVRVETIDETEGSIMVEINHRQLSTAVEVKLDSKIMSEIINMYIARIDNARNAAKKILNA